MQTEQYIFWLNMGIKTWVFRFTGLDPEGIHKSE